MTVMLKILEAIEAHDTIAIFRHENPDGDALGSQVGLATWIKSNYPTKTVWVLGSNDHHYTLYPKMDEVEDLGEFLSIVVDTANQPRVDDKRYINGTMIIKIDHHPEVDMYGDLQHVDVKRGSCCEIITDMLASFDKILTSDNADLLLSGIMTDTIRFSTESTSEKTLLSAAYLISKGASISRLNQLLFTQPRAIFNLKAHLMSLVQVKDKLAYIKMDAAAIEALGVLTRDIKGQVNIMAGVQEFEVWTILVEQDGFFEASVRSRNNTINDIAGAFGGGGHRLASGVGKLDETQSNALLDALAKRSLEN